MLKTRSNALDSSIPAFTRLHWYYLPILGVPSAKAEGVPRGWGAGMAENEWGGRVKVKLRLKIIMGTSAGARRALRSK